jgi:hypothetical protein
VLNAEGHSFMPESETVSVPPARFQVTGGSRRIVMLVLLALGLLVTAGRLYTASEPLERDLTAYALIGHELLNGHRLYTDVWDHKPPGIHLIYAAAEAIAGYDLVAVLLLNIVAALATLPGVYLAARAGMGRRAGLWAAVLWALLSLNLPLEANQPNTEVFINLALVWALWLFLRDTGRAMSWRSALVIGALCAAATLVKHIALLPFVGLAMASIVVAPSWRTRLLRMVAAAGVVVAAWLAVVAYFAADGRYADFHQAVFTYNRMYVGSVWTTLGEAADIKRAAFLLAALVVPGVALLAGHQGASVGPLGRYWILVGCALATAAHVAAPGQWHKHYFQLWSPVLAVGLGWGAALLAGIGGGQKRWLADVAAAVVVMPLAVTQVTYYRLSPEEWSVHKHGPDFVYTRLQAEELNRLLLPEETFFHLGSHPGLYLYTGRRPATGMFYLPVPRRQHSLHALVAGPATGDRARRMIEDLERAKPDLLVLARLTLYDLQRHPEVHQNPLVAYCANEYVPIAGNDQRPFFALLVRRGSAAATRLVSASDGPRLAGVDVGSR